MGWVSTDYTFQEGNVGEQVEPDIQLMQPLKRGCTKWNLLVPTSISPEMGNKKAST